ncbi:MAG: MBL fold metallo-hydrolase [Planctomycetota bacterium]|jgi:phosphoribosyl 1,2-cyclic phosphate phosphodiesterase
MSKHEHSIGGRTSRDVRGRMVLLGTGTSVGVPCLGCDCDVCTGGHPRNQRTRTSAILGLPEGNLLIDTSPDLRMQLLREKISLVHAVIYTHEHADHLHGLDDVRLFPFILGHAMPLYATTTVEDRIRRVFDYAFANREQTHAGAVPQLELRRLDEKPLRILGADVTPIPLIHGPHCHVLGFRFGNVAYCTDTNRIEPASLELLRGLDVLILDALRIRPHATHFSVPEALDVIEELQPKRAYLIHLSHELDYTTCSRELPEHVHLAYDGLEIELT